MRHVDEGAIHAWLDEQISDPAEAAWIDEHFRGCGECRARLAEERATFDRAETLLAGATPSAERPSFESLVAKAGGDLHGVETPSGARLIRGPRDRVLMLASWAASLALAVGLGWTARELTDLDTVNQTATSVIAERPGVSIPPPAKPAEVAPPDAEPVAGAQVSRQRAAAAPRPAAPGTRIESATPAQERAASTPVAETARAAAPPPALTPAAPAAVRQEAVRIAAESRPSTVRPGTEWDPLPRTEAAARTGMPLYGIDGVEPLITAISPDGTLVRTTYRLASGETVELLQQRAVPDSLADVQATRRGLAGSGGGGGAVPGRVTSPGRTLSIVRGDLRLTLRTSSDGTDLDSLGTQLRID